jgi:hypothetical protein
MENEVQIWLEDIKQSIDEIEVFLPKEETFWNLKRT